MRDRDRLSVSQWKPRNRSSVLFASNECNWKIAKESIGCFVPTAVLPKWKPRFESPPRSKSPKTIPASLEPNSLPGGVILFRMRICSLVVLSSAALFAQPKSVLIEDLTWTEVRDAIAAGSTTAIYYAGSIEQNGPGMALGKHLFLAHYISQRIAQQLGNALVYPTMPFAPTGDPVKKTGHMRFSGSVNISDEATRLVAHDVALSAISAGFKNVVLMSDHGGAGQEALKKVAAELDPEWGPKGAHVYYIPDLYFKEKEQMRKYLTERKMAIDQHAGVDDTSEVMYIDKEHRWIRKEKLAADTGKMGVSGDPTQATPELGQMFVNFKIEDAVSQIKLLISQGR
jgi:creatinine amidohydrolase